jgi:hypothetical protein
MRQGWAGVEAISPKEPEQLGLGWKSKKAFTAQKDGGSKPSERVPKDLSSACVSGPAEEHH